MRTVEKALKLLGFFDQDRPAIGLSDMARLSGLDKATTHRMLTALAAYGFVEQDVRSKQYRLGASVLQLARVREATFPVTAITQPILAQLTARTGETSHLSLLAGRKLAIVGVAESSRANRVFVEPGLHPPFHATASGIAVLAFSPPALLERLLTKPLERFTPRTIVEAAALRKAVGDAARAGFGQSDQGFEADVYGIAAPLFDTAGAVSGAVAVAAPASRIDAQARSAIGGAVIAAAIEITRALGAEPPAAYRALNVQTAA